MVVDPSLMPRITAAHEQEVRDRIVVAALQVFSEHGFHRATMQDVVRASGLSVGAIYTYFSSKDELFLASCDLTAGNVAGTLASRLLAGTTTTQKLAIAVGFFLDGVDVFFDDATGAPGAPVLIQAWAEAEQEPAVREMLVRRREQIVTIGRMLLLEGIARGELPAWVDAEALARAYSALLDGLLLLRVEAGPRYGRADALRHAESVLEILLAANGSSRPIVPVADPEPYAHLKGFAASR